MPQPDKSQYELYRNFTYQPCFEQNSSFLSRMFFLWSHELIRRGNSKHLQMEDLSDLRANQQAPENHQQFSNIFYSLNPFSGKRLLQSFKKYLGFTFIAAGVLATVANLLQFAGPLMINNILVFLNSDNNNISEGVLYVSILIGCYLLRTLIFQHSMHFVNLCCTRVLNSANSLIYHKILNLSSASRKYLQTGSIMNHINVDIMSFYFFIMMSTFVFSAPIMIITAIVMLILEIGWIGLIAPVMFGVGMFFQQKLTKKGFELRKDQLFWTDKRTKCVNEYFSGIRIIKYYGWEKLVSEKIEAIRTEEINLSFRSLMLRTYIEVIMTMLPIFASIVIFAVYSTQSADHLITPAKVYTVLSVFNLIAVPMRLLIMTLINFMNAKASLDRIDHFFGYQEKTTEGFDGNDLQLTTGDIVFGDCVFDWDNETVKKHWEEGKKFTRQNPGQTAPKPVPPKPKKKKVKKNTIDGELPKKKKKKTKKRKQEGAINQSLLSQISLSEGQSLSSSSSNKPRNAHALQIQGLKIPSGQFVTVVGRVGCGKSTFLYSILGQIDKVSGTVSRRGTIAYIPQVSWLRSATIRQNILFESEYDEMRYKNILKICQLTTDLEILSGNDLTQIGEKGVNLSGGQKQRISIARALYADADIYLVDDCLSALDPYVAKNIFFNVLKDYLHKRGKTIVFVTNAVHFAEYGDRVILIDDGQIVDDGAPQQLKRNESRVYENLLLQNKKSKDKEQQMKEEEQKRKQEELRKNQQELQIKLDDEEEKEVKPQVQPKEAALIKVEERLKGSVPWKFYYRFFTGPGVLTATLMFLFISLAQMARVFSDWWLGEWGNSDKNSFNLNTDGYIGIYAGVSVVVGVLIYLKGIFFAKFIISTSRVIQRKLIATLLRTPLNWFDVTPTGRIISRTTKDQDDLDTNLSFNIQFATQNLLVMLSSIVIISVATPIYLIVAAVSGLVYYKLIGYYMNSSREIKRLEANTRSPLISHISETINGVYVIRAFNKSGKFIAKYFMRQKALMVCIVNQNITNRWINIVTDLFTIVTIAAAGYFGVLKVVQSSNNLVGLALVWSLQISSIMSFTLRLLADTESCMNSVVRLYEYIDNNPSEADFEEPKPREETWPRNGNYNIERASFRYRPELPLVLKSISFDIKSREKIGIVGRTGSGKSTMTLGLLRILQLTENEDGQRGVITLDQQNTSNLGLHFLRHKITIIPQDPTLFTGTIKSNIDPFDLYSDNEIADSLRKVSLWDQIKDQPDERNQIRRKIYSKVNDSGSNFSLGQKQLICMSRALIRKPKVLLMDEATASIDEKTDETIQKMIREEFTETTVITIAHRLNTIIYYDKILVLEKGEIKEYDAPLKLVRDPESFLGKLIRKTGDTYMRRIISLAENYERNRALPKKDSHR